MNARELFNDIDKMYVYLERYINAGSPSGFTEMHKTSYETNPFTGQDKFSLLQFSDEDIETIIIGENLPEFWGESYNFAHPDSIESINLLQSNRILTNTSILVSPTSGGRTMYVWDKEPNGYLKLTYDVSRIGRVDRQLSTKHCLASYESSETLREAFNSKKFPNTMAMQLEPSAKISILPTANGCFEWGVIFREKEPFPYINEPRQLIPGFSLFYDDLKNEPLIVQFIRLGKYNPLDYLIDLLKIIVDCYWNIVIHCGFHIECHGQNCLFEIDHNYKIKRIVIKDMDSVDKDIPLAKFLGLKTRWASYPQCCFDHNIYFYNIRSSYMYDFKLGEYLLSPLINAVSSTFDIDTNLIQNYIKEYVNLLYIHKLPTNYFPNDGCWYDCDNTERQPGTRRKYNSHSNPKYR